MPLIDGPSVWPDLRRVTVEILVSLGAIVVRAAQRLQFTVHEQIPIALMWHDMVDH
jgi:hypothetical protein